jgi:hypothetical protein
MKRKIFFIIPSLCVCLLLFCAFKIDPHSSLKDLTHPYINTYECTYAQLGETNLLENYEYFKITFLDDKTLEVSFKKKGEKRHAYETPYTIDESTGAFTAEIGILGFKFRQTTTIKDGKFTLSMPILTKQLVMQFAVK